jgi:hypothetical protein
VCRFGVTLALASVTSPAAFSQDAFEAALATLPGEVRQVSSAGRWRTPDAAGFYRVIEARGGYERIADRLYIQWVREGSEDQPPNVIATVGVSEINDAGPFTLSYTLYAEATNRLRISVNASHGYTRQRRQLVFVAAAPGMYSERQAPSSLRPK